MTHRPPTGRAPLITALLIAAGLLSSLPAAAQTGNGSEAPAEPALSPADREDLRDQTGTTIVGERESPIGLYITPWRDAYSEQDIDRPARLLQVDMSPIDREVFARQAEYHKALTESGQNRPGTGSPTITTP